MNKVHYYLERYKYPESKDEILEQVRKEIKASGAKLLDIEFSPKMYVNLVNVKIDRYVNRLCDTTQTELNFSMNWGKRL